MDISLNVKRRGIQQRGEADIQGGLVDTINHQVVEPVCLSILIDSSPRYSHKSRYGEKRKIQTKKGGLGPVHCDCRVWNIAYLVMFPVTPRY